MVGGEATGGGTQVFICHASSDAALASRLVRSLEREGARCWLAPRDIAPGSEYADAIVGAIEASTVIVFLFSHASDRSSHCRSELELAKNRSLPLIPVRLDGTLPSGATRYFLSTTQWLDAVSIEESVLCERLAVAIRLVGSDRVDVGAGSSIPRARRRPLLACLAIVLVACVAGLLLRDGSSGRAQERVEAGGAAASSDEVGDATSAPAIVAERKDAAVVLFEDAIDSLTPWSGDLGNLSGAPPFDEPEQEAAILGAWWALADWCEAEGFGRTGVCYDKSATFLIEYIERDPRTINTQTWGRPGAIGGVLGAGYDVTAAYLEMPASALMADLIRAPRPGFDTLCEPTCTAVID